MAIETTTNSYTAPEMADAPRPTTRRTHTDAAIQVRAADLEPYVGLKYLSKLFKLMGVVMILLLVAEVITGLVAQGTEAVPTLLGEVSRLVVLAGLLWGSGDLAILLIDIGHDVRATRILMGRATIHHDPILTSAATGDSARLPRVEREP
jgi:hypothetical protein